jgi:hypothetical protein
MIIREISVRTRAALSTAVRQNPTGGKRTSNVQRPTSNIEVKKKPLNMRASLRSSMLDVGRWMFALNLVAELRRIIWSWGLLYTPRI